MLFKYFVGEALQLHYLLAWCSLDKLVVDYPSTRLDIGSMAFRFVFKIGLLLWSFWFCCAMDASAQGPSGAPDWFLRLSRVLLVMVGVRFILRFGSLLASW